MAGRRVSALTRIGPNKTPGLSHLMCGIFQAQTPALPGFQLLYPLRPATFFLSRGSASPKRKRNSPRSGILTHTGLSSNSKSPCPISAEIASQATRPQNLCQGGHACHGNLALQGLPGKEGGRHASQPSSSVLLDLGSPWKHTSGCASEDVSRRV